MVKIDAPASNEIEVSVFGPSLGECIVLHLGNNDWIVVDSFIEAGAEDSIALEYLRSIQLEPNEVVRAVVATHAHDDHVRGIAGLVRACPGARFICPAAMTTEEFVAVLGFDEIPEGVRPKAFAEFNAIALTFEERRASGAGVSSYSRATEGRVVFRRVETDSAPAVEILALTPSDRAVTLSTEYLASLLPVEGRRKKRLAERDANTTAVALWVQIGDIGLLLGSDVENGPGDECGWNGVLASAWRPRTPAVFVKVPHHGDDEAHHPGMWQQFLQPNPTAAVTPYWRGRRFRPDPQDRERICAQANASFTTASERWDGSNRTVRRVLATLSGVAANVHEVGGLSGQVRVRITVDNPETLEVVLVDPARELCA